MSINVGTSQTSIQITTAANTATHNYYFTKFVSDPLNQSGVAANTWTYNFAANEASPNANFPVASTGSVYVNCYVWRPSTGALVGTILDGNSVTGYTEPSSASSEKVMHGTFTGAAVASAATGDVIVFEVWFQITQGLGSAFADIFYFDGTTENATANAVVTSQASYISTPENIIFVLTYTKLYFHAATSTVTGTLPSTIQSALGACAANCLAVDAATVNRSMNTTIGTAQTSLQVVAAATTTKNYFTRFCSLPLNMTSLAADTWNFAFAAVETSLTGNFPCTGAAQVLNITCYIWRPSTGAKIATIKDGNSNATFSEQTIAGSEYSLFGSFAGAAVSFAVGDIICFEVYFTVAPTTSSVNTFYYDGTTETNNNNTQVSNHASFISTQTQLLVFGSALTRITSIPTLKYALKARIPTLRILKYGLKARIAAPRTLKYKLTARLLLAKTLKYGLKHRIPVARTVKYKLTARLLNVRIVKYALKKRIASQRTTLYALKKRIPTQKTLAYALKRRIPSQRTTKYALRLKVVTARTLKYKLTARLPIVKTVKYSLRKTVTTNRTIKYGLKARIATVRTLKYALKRRIPTQRTIKYALRLKVVTVRTIKYKLTARVLTVRILKYGLKHRVTTIKTVKYALQVIGLTRIGSVKTLQYGLKLRVPKQSTLKYKLLIPIKTNRIIKYGLKLRVPSFRTLKYTLRKRVPTIRTFKYALRLKVVTSRTIKYGLKARLKSIKTIVYQLAVVGALTRLTTVRTVKYKLTARLRIAKALKYSLKLRVVKPQTLKYSLRKSVQSFRIVKYSLRSRLQSSRVLRYALRSRLKSSKSLKYSLLKRIAFPSSKVLKYSLTIRVATSRILKYKLTARLRTSAVLVYRLGLSFFHRIQSRITLIYELLPTYWLMPRFDRVLENFIRNNYSNDVNVINPPNSQISWGKVWDAMGTNTRTVLKCVQMPTKLTQLDPPQQVRLESTPVMIKITHRDQENSRAPLLQNMENYLIAMIWNNVTSDQIKSTGVNHMLPISYNYIDVDKGIFELDIIVNMYFFRKIPAV